MTMREHLPEEGVLATSKFGGKSQFVGVMAIRLPRKSKWRSWPI